MRRKAILLAVFTAAVILALASFIKIYTEAKAYEKTYINGQAASDPAPTTLIIINGIDEATPEAVLEPLVAEQPELVTESVEEEKIEEGQAVALYDVPLAEDLQLHIIQLCEERHIEPEIILAMIDQESTFRSDAVGDNGNSLGLMQIQPRWHKERMESLGCDNLLDPYQNVTVGVDILAEHLEKDKGMEWALMAYNGGESYANKMMASYTVSKYVGSVLEKSDKLKEGVQMIYTDDPVADFNAWDAEQNMKLEMRPVCADCDQHIQEETAFYINGEWICEVCMDAYRQEVLPE